MSDERRYSPTQVELALATAHQYDTERSSEETFLSRSDIEEILIQSGYENEVITRSLAVIDNTGLEQRLVSVQTQIDAKNNKEENWEKRGKKKIQMIVQESMYEGNGALFGTAMATIIGGLIAISISIAAPAFAFPAFMSFLMGLPTCALGGYAIGKKVAKRKNESIELEIEDIEDEIKEIERQLTLTKEYPIFPNSLVLYMNKSDYILGEVLSCENKEYEIQYSLLSALENGGKHLEIIRRKVRRGEILGVLTASQPLVPEETSKISMKEPLFYCEGDEIAEYGFLVKRDVEHLYLNHVYPASDHVLPISRVSLSNIRSGKGSLYKLALAR